MFRWKAAENEYKLNKALARHAYSNAFWTTGAPFLLFISMMSGPIDRSGGFGAFFTNHWLVGTLVIIVFAGFLVILAVEICLARAYSKKAADILRNQ